MYICSLFKLVVSRNGNGLRCHFGAALGIDILFTGGGNFFTYMDASGNGSMIQDSKTSLPIYSLACMCRFLCSIQKHSKKLSINEGWSTVHVPHRTCNPVHSDEAAMASFKANTSARQWFEVPAKALSNALARPWFKVSAQALSKSYVPLRLDSTCHAIELVNFCVSWLCSIIT